MSHFIVRTNIVICNFKGINRCVASNVFLSQCYHWYGCQAWSLESKHIGTFDVTWRKAVRKVWYIPYIFRSKLLPELVDVSTVCFKAMKLFSTMYNIIMIMCKSQNSTLWRASVRKVSARDSQLAPTSLCGSASVRMNMACCTGLGTHSSIKTKPDLID